jgi:hypothetical protein
MPGVLVISLNSGIIFKVTFSGLRLISAVETGGLRLNVLNIYVKTFFISFSIDGKQWRIYKSGFSRVNLDLSQAFLSLLSTILYT